MAYDLFGRVLARLQNRSCSAVLCIVGLLATEVAIRVDVASAQDVDPVRDAVVEATQPEAGAPPPGASGIEVIVVSAQRRDEDLQKIAESVSSFSAEEILQQGMANFNDLQFSVPNLFSGDGLSKITLRGVGSEIVGPGVDPGFAVHVNGVFSARESTGRFDFFDVERVDVLRGPQGTLWGRNSTGGAVNIITIRPAYEFDTSADFEYESFQTNTEGIRARGMLNIPLVEDRVAARFAFLTNFNDGLTTIRGDTNDQSVNDAGVISLRGSLRWQPSEELTIDLIGTYFRSDGDGVLPVFDGDYFSPPIDYSAGSGPGTDYTGAIPNPTNPYRANNDEPQRSDRTVYTATLLVEWTGESLSLESITGYQSSDFFIHRDQDGSNLPISTLDLTDESRQVSQEIIVNSTWDYPVGYTVGTIYQYDWTPRTDIFIPNAQNTALSSNYRLLAGPRFVDGCPARTNPPDPGCPPDTSIGDNYEDFVRALTSVENHVFGLYGNLRWDILDALTLSVGGRYSYTERDWDDETVGRTYVPVVPPMGSATVGLQILQLGQAQEEDWQAGTWKVALEYQATEDHFLWTSVGTGSRAGGFNFSNEQPFAAERIFAVEEGYKGVFLDRRLLINVTGFWYDWDDPQIGSTEDSLPITVNAPSAQSYGIELEWRARPMDELELSGSFGWLEAEYDKSFRSADTTRPDFTTPLSATSPIVDIKGERLPRSPRFTASAGAQYSIDFDRYGLLVPRVDFYYRGAFNFRQYGNRADRQGGYTRTDLRVTWLSHAGNYWVELFMRNVENEAVKTNQELTGGIYRLHYYDAPRSGGFRMGYYFQ